MEVGTSRDGEEEGLKPRIWTVRVVASGDGGGRSGEDGSKVEGGEVKGDGDGDADDDADNNDCASWL